MSLLKKDLFGASSQLEYWNIRTGLLEDWNNGILVIKTKKLINSFSSSKPIIPVFHYSNIPCGLFPTFHHSMWTSQFDRDKKTYDFNIL